MDYFVYIVTLITSVLCCVPIVNVKFYPITNLITIAIQGSYIVVVIL